MYILIHYINILMKIRKLATIPLRTDDRDAPLVVGTPRTEQVAKKTENAAKERICRYIINRWNPKCVICDICEWTHPPLWPWVRCRTSSRQLHWINLVEDGCLR